MFFITQKENLKLLILILSLTGRCEIKDMKTSLDDHSEIRESIYLCVLKAHLTVSSKFMDILSVLHCHST